MKISKEVLQELIDCYDDNNLEHTYFFNTKTNEITFISSYLSSSEYEELMEEIEFGENYYRVPQTDSREGFQDMEEFIETVNSEKIQSELYRAISRSRGVFRNFKDVLMEYPDVQERYYKFKDEKNKERVLEWLRDEFNYIPE